MPKISNSNSIRLGANYPRKIYLGANAVWTWSPALLPLAIWLDADDASTITLNGSNVSQWRDKSGNSRHAAQTTAAKQPALVLAAINQKPALSYSVAGQTLNMASTIAVTADMMVVSVFNRAAAGIQTIDVASNNINTTPFGLWWGTTNFVNNGIGTGTAAIIGNSTATGTFISASTRTATTSVCQSWLNGAQFGTDKPALTLGGTFETIGYRPGTNQTHNGLLAEIIVTTTVTTDNRQRIEGYLAHKWGLANSLPASHPYRSSAP